MGKPWFLCTLVILAGFAAAQPSPEPAIDRDDLPDVEWRVSAQFPQMREVLPFRGVRWRTPVIPNATGTALESVLPGPSESWEDPASALAWYERVARRGFSPYAGATANDAWLEGSQRYDPTFLEYVLSESVFVSVSSPNGMLIREGCTWLVDGRDAGLRQGCLGAELLIPINGATVSLLDGGELVAESSIRPKRMVILALGDSYAAGEGNPDRPTRWSDDSVATPGERNQIKWLAHSLATPNSLVLEDAEWRDPVCHRSFWNQQSFAAMRLAADDPRREIVFMQFACSGAEILDGLLVRQLNAPGSSLSDKGGCDSALKVDCRVRRSQLAAAVTALCDGETSRFDELTQSLTPAIDYTGPNRWQKLGAYRHFQLQTRPPFGMDLLRCNGRMVTPDLVLLSVGGNDAGFANLLAWALMPTRGHVPATWPLVQMARAMKVICPDGGGGLGCQSPTAEKYARQLPGRFALLDKALEQTSLAPDSRLVVMSSYPNPLRTDRIDADGSPGLCSDNSSQGSPWEALNATLSPTLRPFGNWEFLIRSDGSGRNGSAARTIDGSVLPEMHENLLQSANAAGFTFVKDTETAFYGRTWCDEDAREKARLALPSRAPDAWDGGSPVSWRPYQHRARVIRTANDSYMTQVSTGSGDANGTMHPTAEGHLLLAVPVYGAARRLKD